MLTVLTLVLRLGKISFIQYLVSSLNYLLYNPLIIVSPLLLSNLKDSNNFSNNSALLQVLSLSSVKAS